MAVGSVVPSGLVVLALAVSGCTLPCHTPGHAVGERVDDWQSGVELVSYYSWRYHNGNAGDRLVHNDTDPLPLPASCQAHRGGEKFSKDSCLVRTGPDDEWGLRPDAAWTLLAAWAGGDCDADRTRGDSIVAFDDAGRPVAWWDGRLDDGASVMTE